MPVIVLHKRGGQTAVLTGKEKELLIFPDKNAAKRYLAARGIYGLVGYEFHEIEVKPDPQPQPQIEPQEEGHADPEPAA